MDPNHARYQLRYTRKQLIYYKRNFIRCQDIRQKNLARKIKEFFGTQKETPLTRRLSVSHALCISPLNGRQAAYRRSNWIFMSTRPLMPATMQLLENCQ